MLMACWEFENAIMEIFNHWKFVLWKFGIADFLILKKREFVYVESRTIKTNLELWNCEMLKLLVIWNFETSDFYCL